MKAPPSYFTLTKSQRRGIVWTLAIFLALHLGFRFYPKPQPNPISGLVLDSLMQRRVDSLIAIKPDVYKDTIY